MPEIMKRYTTGNSRYRSGQTFNPTGVVLHSIGTPQPNAQALWSYWQNNGSAYVTHYVIDDHQIIQCMPDNYKCWHVGSPGNAKWVGIEMCEPKQIHYTSGAKFTVSDLGAAQKFVGGCYTNAVWLLAQLCRRYGWNPETAILTHGEVSKKKLSNTDHVDPEHLWNGLGMGYNLYQLRKDVDAKMGKIESAPTTTIDVSSHPTLRKGDRGEAVMRMQQLLIRAGYNFSPWGADGIFGDYTDSIVRAFQAKSGLSADGICGRLTWAALEAAGTAAGRTGRLVRITARSGLNVRSGPGTGYDVVKTLAYGGAYTIVEERDGWGKLKSGIGWICLAYTERL